MAPDHRPHLVDSVARAVVVPPRELPHVPAQVLRAHLVVRPVVAPLEHRPEALDTVRVGLPPDVLPARVSDRLVRAREPDVRAVLVRVDLRALRRPLPDDSRSVMFTAGSITDG